MRYTEVHNIEAQRVRPARFQKMKRAIATALSAIYQPRLPLIYRFKDQEISVRPRPPGPAMRSPFRVDFGNAARFGPLDMDQLAVKRVLALIDPDMAETAMSREAVELALLHVFGPALDKFEAASGQRIKPRLTEIQAAGHDGKTAVDFTVAVGHEDASAEPARCRLWLPEAELPKLAAVISKSMPPSLPHLDVSLPISIQLGRCRLTVSELRALSAGDVVLAEDLAGEWPSAWLVVAGKRRVPLSVNAREARINGILEPHMNDQQDQNLQDGAVSDLEVDIKFELGRSHMPVGQLQMLGEGGVIPLERDFSSPVDVIVGGRRVGEGEIVDIDGRVGIRLLRFQHS